MSAPPPGNKHAPLDAERHADLVLALQRYQPSLFMALFQRNVYVYDDADRELAIDLESECRLLREAFDKATEWRDAMRILKSLKRREDRRRDISIGIDIGTHVIYGEPIA